MREFFDGENRTSASLPHMPFTFTKSKKPEIRKEKKKLVKSKTAFRVQI